MASDCAGSGYFGVDISAGEIGLIDRYGLQLQIANLLTFVIEIHIEKVINSFV